VDGERHGKEEEERRQEGGGRREAGGEGRDHGALFKTNTQPRRVGKNKRVRQVDACSSQTLPKRRSHSEYDTTEGGKSPPQKMCCLKNL